MKRNKNKNILYVTSNTHSKFKKKMHRTARFVIKQNAIQLTGL